VAVALSSLPCPALPGFGNLHITNSLHPQSMKCTILLQVVRVGHWRRPGAGRRCRDRRRRRSGSGHARRETRLGYGGWPRCPTCGASGRRGRPRRDGPEPPVVRWIWRFVKPERTSKKTIPQTLPAITAIPAASGLHSSPASAARARASRPVAPDWLKISTARSSWVRASAR
jgi:hypothetical protein